MQDSLVKRNFLSRIRSLDLDEQECGYQAPRKFIKKSLQIEIPELSTNENIPLSIPSLCPKTSKFIFNSFKNTPTGKPSTSTPTRQSDMTPKKSEFGNMFVENNNIYDDYTEEDEFFSITMKKCHRKNMEDRATFEKVLDSRSKTSFFGVYDGHRNSYASSFLQKNLHKCVLNQTEFATQPHIALKEAFQRLDKEICRNQEKVGLQGGSTALCALLNSDRLHIANIGDCKAILIRNGEPVNLNVEHRANNNEERENVEKRGGFVFEKKGRNHPRYMVQGSLELTRSFGDQAYKPYVSCEPDINEYKLTEDDQFLIIGSDGFWNEVNERETADLINNYSASTGLSSFLVGEAIKNKIYNIDNITLIVVNLQSYAKFRAMMDEI